MNEEWPMPLLCISLLALFLLPLSLSCISDSSRVQGDYWEIVQVDLDNTKEGIMASLRNSSCHRCNIRRCASDPANVTSTLHDLTCKMKNLRISDTEGLIMSVINSLGCPCPGKSTKEPSVKLRTATRRRRNEQRKKEKKKLCRAKAILSNMTECYQILNTLRADVWDQTPENFKAKRQSLVGLCKTKPPPPPPFFI